MVAGTGQAFQLKTYTGRGGGGLGAIMMGQPPRINEIYNFKWVLQASRDADGQISVYASLIIENKLSPVEDKKYLFLFLLPGYTWRGIIYSILIHGFR